MRKNYRPEKCSEEEIPTGECSEEELPNRECSEEEIPSQCSEEEIPRECSYLVFVPIAWRNVYGFTP